LDNAEPRTRYRGSQRCYQGSMIITAPLGS
jgi:hypothetical protein